MPRPSFGSFADMPVGLRRFLFSKEFSGADKTLEETYHIPKELFEKVGDAIMDTIFNDLSLAEGVAAIRQILVPAALTEEMWKPFLIELVRLEFWPIRDLFGEELSFWLAEQQIGTGGWPMQRVLLKPLTYSSAATELAQRAGFSIMGSQLRERLRDLIVSKIKGVRIDAQIRETLMRQQDFGGIGLDARQADATIAALNELLQTVEVLSESEYADWLTEETQKQSEATVSEENGSSSDEDDPEISAIKTKMKAQPATPPSILDQAVQQALSQIRDKPTDEYLLRRMQNVIASRLRDVRNSLEMRQILTRDSKVGGVGMTAEQANAAVEVVEAAYQASHTSIMDDEKKKLETQMVFQQQKIEERKKREAEEHARWYQEKILAKKQAEERQTQAADQFRKQYAAGLNSSPAPQAAPVASMAPVDAKEQHLEQKRFGSMVQAVQVGAQPIGQAAAVDVAARPEVKISAATTPIKPRMDGVVAPPVSLVGPTSAGPKLMGLTGELSELSLTEFRRMAKTPDEAVEKILQKVETLGQESFERRVEGVRAFQASPLQGSYMALVAESFRSGKPVAALADEKRAKGENTLSPTEISAILTLNSKLHF